MSRYFAEISYKGTDFHGWQIQPNAITVQETITKALSTLLQQDIEIVGCGRTDTGVHAQYFILHFDSINTINTEQLQFKLNCFLPKSIAIKRILPVQPNAHARFDALSRTYQYIIAREKNPFKETEAYLYTRPLNISLMNEAAKILLKHEDFTSFSKLHTDVKTNLCKITEAYWTSTEQSHTFTITANRFLRNMVRAIVGTLLLVGKEQCSLAAFENIILSKNRGNAGSSAPAEGLYLTHINYPPNIYL